MIHLLLILLSAELATARVFLPSLHWNIRNKLFKNDTGEPCRNPPTMYVDFGAIMYVVCPHVYIEVAESPYQLYMFELYENLHMVTERGFNSCTVDRDDSLLVKCDKGENTAEMKYDLLAFTRRNWNGWMFKPGQSYYFINTANGQKSSLDNKSGGRCATHNMKLKVHICNIGENCGKKCKNYCCEKPPTTTPPPTTTRPTTTTKPTTTTTMPTTTTRPETTTISTTKVLPTTVAEKNTTTTLPRTSATQDRENVTKELSTTVTTKQVQKEKEVKSDKLPSNSRNATRKGNVGNSNGNNFASKGAQNQQENDNGAWKYVYIMSGFLGVLVSLVIILAVIVYRRRSQPSYESSSDGTNSMSRQFSDESSKAMV